MFRAFSVASKNFQSTKNVFVAFPTVTVCSPSYKATFATYKTTTGLVGLKVDPEGRENLLRYSEKVLKEVQRIPVCQYRKDVEAFFNYFAKVCQEKVDVNTLFLSSSFLIYCFFYCRLKILKRKFQWDKSKN
jgi:hypothetical protein